MAGGRQQQQVQPKIHKSFNLFNPGGDPSVLRACAEAWRDMAQDLKSTIETQDQEVARLGDNWTGAAAEAFHQHWAHTKQQVERALPHFATVAQQLETTADAIAKANTEVHHVIEELAVTAAVGIGLSLITAGFSDAVAAGAAEAEVAEAAGEITRLGQLLIKVSEVLEKIKTLMEDSKLLKFGVEFGKNLGANFVGNVGGQAVTGQQITWGQDLQDAAVAAGVGTGITSAGGALAGKVTDWSANTGAHAAEEAWAPGTKIASVLDGSSLAGGFAMGAVGSAGGQAAADGVDISEGGKHGSDVVPDMLTSGVTGGVAGAANHGAEKLVEPGPGKHRADGETATFDPGAQIGMDGLIYGAGNAVEYDLEN